MATLGSSPRLYFCNDWEEENAGRSEHMDEQQNDEFSLTKTWSQESFDEGRKN